MITYKLKPKIIKMVKFNKLFKKFLKIKKKLSMIQKSLPKKLMNKIKEDYLNNKLRKCY